MKNLHKVLAESKDILVEYLKNREYHKILGCIEKMACPYMQPKRDQDIYRITPYDDSVSLTYGCEYLNASFVELCGFKFIACQTPKCEYTSQFLDFLVKADIRLIIALRFECGYFNEDMLINRTEIFLNGNCFLYDEVYCVDNRRIRRIRCLTWEDHSIISEVEMDKLYIYLEEIFESQDYRKSIYGECGLETGRHIGPHCLIHCKAGVGRTGTFILYKILRKLGPVTEEDFIELLIHMRTFRSHLIENICQLRFLVEKFIK